VEQAKILIVSDDREFLNSILQSWQRLRFSPEYAVAAPQAGGTGCCAVAILDGCAPAAWLGEECELAIVIGDESLPELSGGVRAVGLARASDWTSQAAALAQETLLRLAAQAQLAELKARQPELERYAALGRFIVEARHAMGNALTGVMGNSELLLMEANTGLRSDARTQLETIHSMSLKMHETFHRLSSLEMELKVAERQAKRDAQRRPVQ
jgi:signal transduction histidine kinase